MAVLSPILAEPDKRGLGKDYVWLQLQESSLYPSLKLRVKPLDMELRDILIQYC